MGGEGDCAQRSVLRAIEPKKSGAQCIGRISGQNTLVHLIFINFMVPEFYFCVDLSATTKPSN
jgi:hypothetical protein